MTLFLRFLSLYTNLCASNYRTTTSGTNTFLKMKNISKTTLNASSTRLREFHSIWDFLLVWIPISIKIAFDPTCPLLLSTRFMPHLTYYWPIIQEHLTAMIRILDHAFKCYKTDNNNCRRICSSSVYIAIIHVCTSVIYTCQSDYIRILVYFMICSSHCLYTLSSSLLTHINTTLEAVAIRIQVYWSKVFCEANLKDIHVQISCDKLSSVSAKNTTFCGLFKYNFFPLGLFCFRKWWIM